MTTPRKTVLCTYCRRAIHMQRNGEWYHDDNASVSCRPGWTSKKATPGQAHLLAEVERLTAELAAMTELHDQKHRDWQMADNARQGLLVDRGNLRADLQLYEPARHGDASYWIHACGWVEVWSGDWTPTDGGCDACESGSDVPADWQPLYVRRGGEPS